MGMESDVQSVKQGETDANNAVLVYGSSATVQEEPAEEEESEEEDVDFNPFTKESLSEASSSLSSEAEGLDADVVDSHGEIAGTVDNKAPANRPSDIIDEGECGGDRKNNALLLLAQEIDKTTDNEIGSNSGTDVVEDVVEAEGNLVSSRDKPIIDLNDEDAICKRTRARYSLASFTLDELETFLQETDDDDDIQNVDEEEEYRKFLDAVLNAGNGDSQGNSDGNDDDDDEDNDADFEIEIEEALESDIEDCAVMSITEKKFERARRPETRQKGHQKAIAQKKKVTKRGKRPLRPLVPVISTAAGTSAPCLGPRYLAVETSLQLPSRTHDGSMIGFQAHQIGQLYCLIYEHVQLLVQTYSLCVLEPSRQHIESQIKGLLCELQHKRDLVLAWRNGPYPTSCFLPSYTCPSVSVGNKKHIPVEDSHASPNDCQGSPWLPSVGSSVLSVLDVVPLTLVGRYINDVSNAVQEHQRRCLETSNVYLEKQPLFPLPICSSPEVDSDVSLANDSSLNSSKVSTKNIVPKKTLAATLVESSMKQSVALVHPQIAKLAQPFYSLFNPALFPHKPPSSAVANRVLFTDSEDVLLAMGMMEYNNDWKAIQQRFLPCKSEHQIFVRAKNRCSSKAPDNPIKTVRKMKTSPLTEDEKARIQEGLKIFKLDWTSVWRAVVPYRDPNLLPRQWRVAIGTQKSYKANAAKREKHRIYESKRRREKAAAIDSSLTGSEKENESGEDCMDNDNEAYVHEAFLADWRPTSSGKNPSKMSASSLKPGCQPGDLRVDRFCDNRNREDNDGNQESNSDKDHALEVSAASEDFHLMRSKSMHPYITTSYPPPVLSSKTFGESLFHSQRSGKPKISNLVKLAPELPPVKLPPAVRIISQASLRNSQLGSSTEAGATCPGLEKAFRDPDCSANLVKLVQEKNKTSNSTPASFSSQKDGPMKNRCLTRERGAELDPLMHPLLFRTIEEGHLPCYPINSSLRIPTFSFFPAVQHQMNVTLLQQPRTSAHSFSAKENAPASSSLDFHPLLQREKEFGATPLDASSSGSLINTNLELSRDQYAEDIVYDAGVTAAQTAAAMRPISPSANTNDLDLDIHLSSASKRRKVSSHGVPERNPSFPSVSGTKVVEILKEGSGLHCELSKLAEIADCVARGHLEMALPDNSAALSSKLDGTNDNVGDNLPGEIVMEQEELSDSDEEMEDVEFEREEMADSDGEEGSSADQILSVHSKELEDTALGTDNRDQLLKSIASGASEGTPAQRNGRYSRSSPGGSGKAHLKGSWLSLNSHNSHHKTPRRTKRAESSEGGPLPSYFCRHRKKGNSDSKDVSSEQKTDTSEQDPFFNPTRKSRKPASKCISPSRVDVCAGKSDCTEKDGKV